MFHSFVFIVHVRIRRVGGKNRLSRAEQSYMNARVTQLFYNFFYKERIHYFYYIYSCIICQLDSTVSRQCVNKDRLYKNSLRHACTSNT